MDGDLQNPPEDLPKLVAAVEAGSDVASGRRAARRDSWGRTLPSRLINGMLRRFTGVAISDFGCAFNAYRRDAVEPVLGAIGKQKFTKALVLSTGASVVEVDVGHAAARRRVALLAAPAGAHRARRARRLLAAADPVDRPAARDDLHAAARSRSAAGAIVLLDRPLELPRPAVRRRRGPVRPRRPGLHPRPGRRVPRPNPARRLRAARSTRSSAS